MSRLTNRLWLLSLLAVSTLLAFYLINILIDLVIFLRRLLFEDLAWFLSSSELFWLIYIFSTLAFIFLDVITNKIIITSCTILLFWLHFRWACWLFVWLNHLATSKISTIKLVLLIIAIYLFSTNLLLAIPLNLIRSLLHILFAILSCFDMLARITITATIVTS